MTWKRRMKGKRGRFNRILLSSISSLCTESRWWKTLKLVPKGHVVHWFRKYFFWLVVDNFVHAFKFVDIEMMETVSAGWKNDSLHCCIFLLWFFFFVWWKWQPMLVVSHFQLTLEVSTSKVMRRPFHPIEGFLSLFNDLLWFFKIIFWAILWWRWVVGGRQRRVGGAGTIWWRTYRIIIVSFLPCIISWIFSPLLHSVFHDCQGLRWIGNAARTIESLGWVSGFGDFSKIAVLLVNRPIVLYLVPDER